MILRLTLIFFFPLQISTQTPNVVHKTQQTSSKRIHEIDAQFSKGNKTTLSIWSMFLSVLGRPNGKLCNQTEPFVRESSTSTFFTSKQIYNLEVRSHDHNKQRAYAKHIMRKSSVKRILFVLDHFIKDKYGDMSIVCKFLNAPLQCLQWTWQYRQLHLGKIDYTLLFLWG